MNKIYLGSGPFLSLLVMSLLVLAGCSKDDSKAELGKKQAKQGQDKGTQTAGKKDDHGGWWCAEHGIPEHECLMCLHTEAELKKMGDWCPEHQFAKSQCFKCEPTLREKYAAIFRAKYGKEPPPIQEEESKEKKNK